MRALIKSFVLNRTKTVKRNIRNNLQYIFLWESPWKNIKVIDVAWTVYTASSKRKNNRIVLCWLCSIWNTSVFCIGETNKFFWAYWHTTEETQKEYIHVNNVKAMVLNGGDNFWDLDEGKFLVPYTGPQSPSATFATSLWIGAIDDNDELRLSALDYRNARNCGYESGPMFSDPSRPTEIDYTNWDKIFSVHQLDARSWLLLPACSWSDSWSDICLATGTCFSVARKWMLMQHF